MRPLALAVTALLVLAASEAGARELPPLDRRVVDEAGALAPDRAAALEQKLAKDAKIVAQ